MIGRRVQPDERGFPPPLEPGDYCHVVPVKTWDGRELTEEHRQEVWTKPYWVGRTPGGHGCNLASHGIVEHEDGTITVSPSILVQSSVDRGTRLKELWHGYLERGVWRSC